MRTEKSNTISGENVFKLYDTYGFPKDLTALIAKENNMLIDEIEFESFMKIQQNRSRSVSKKIVSDWITLSDGEHSIFEGYNSLTEEVFVRKYRRVSVGNKKDLYHIILDKTPFYPEGGGKIGMDFSAVRGTPVYATGNGIIKRVDNRAAGFGKHIRIDHGFGYVSIYAHLDKYNVKRGQKVKRGQIIGFVGNTGRSVAPHLHYEIVKDGKKINPINFYYGNLSPDEFNILVQQASQENESLD